MQQRIDSATPELKENWSRSTVLPRLLRAAVISVSARSSSWATATAVSASAWAKPPKSPRRFARGVEDAKRQLITVALVDTSIPHDIEGKFGRSTVRLLRAEEGTGVIAGGPARAVLEMAGVKDIRTKSYGSNNPINCVKATLNGLAQLRTAEEIAKLRGKDGCGNSGLRRAMKWHSLKLLW